MSIETRNVCVISMAHLTEATARMLFDTPLADWPIMGAPIGPDMLCVWACTDPDAHELPADLLAAVKWARAVSERPDGHGGFDYIIFDRDVEPGEDGTGLPDYSAPEPGKAASADGNRADALDRILRDLWRDASITHPSISQEGEARPPHGDDYTTLFARLQAAETMRAEAMAA